MTAIERDQKWLAEAGFTEIDAERFSNWVARLMNDGIDEDEARGTVLIEMMMQP
jgi:hypothetical protein